MRDGIAFADRIPVIEGVATGLEPSAALRAEARNGSPFSALAARLFAAAEPARAVVFLSCKPGEGVTRTVTAIDEFLSSTMKCSSVVLPAEECLRGLPAGRGERNYGSADAAADRTHNAAMGERLALLRRRHRAVLIDAGAIDGAPYVLDLASHVDGFVLVVAAGERDRGEIRRAVEMIEAAHGRVFGIVLNKRQYPIPNWLYRFVR